MNDGSGLLDISRALRGHAAAAAWTPAGGVLVCVSRLDEIETYLGNAGLDQNDFAVLTSDKARNELGAPPELHDAAPIMFVTQQRLKPGRGSTPMAGLSELFYQGHPRALRIWDESAELGDQASPRVDDLGALLGPLRISKPKLAAGIQGLMLEAWQAEPGAVLTVPAGLTVPSHRKDSLADVKRDLVGLGGADEVR